MSDIANIAGHLGSANPRLSRPDRSESAVRPSAGPINRYGRSNEDAVEISADARRLSEGRTADEPTPDMAKVARMRAAIAGDGYDSDARFQIAVDRMIDDVFA